MKNSILLLMVLCTILFANAADIYVETLTIPTYGVADADRNPRFFDGRVYQGAQGRIYPYPISDVLTNTKSDQQYEAVYLENDFIRICVLPEIGGRIFTAEDKTNGYNYFYRQNVIKPSLIGMLGAWISGGVEWNFPHHHRANSFMPMDYTIEENEDGSKTLWLSEIERRHRMKFLLGLTIRPDSNLLEATFKFINRTPLVNSFLYFANPSVHVDSTYQVIFPPETEYVTQHAKREFASWPVANQRYGGMNYDGVDISWWKNLPNPVSFFAWDHQADYFAGYDHGKDAGTAYLGNRHIAPGKKFFTFGCGDEGKMWDEMLTDEDGPYLELMAGAFSDNQPDYSWIQPYEVKEFKQYWFPIRNLDGMVYANKNGAMNYQMQDGNFVLKLNTTTVFDHAVVTIAAKTDTLLSQTLAINPDAPAKLTVALPASVSENDVVVTVSQDDAILMQYQLVSQPGEPLPQPVIPPGEPEKFNSAEELYLAGLRLDQFQNAQVDPYPYYFEALKRDSMDYRTNTQLGILYLKRAMFAEAEKHLRRAVDRITYNYTRPKDGEALYYLGLTLKLQQKYDAAYEAFYNAVWSYAWAGASYFALAQIDCMNKDFPQAQEHLQRALLYNAHNATALNLLTAVSRQLNKFDQAEILNEMAIQFDPLDYNSRTEQMFLGDDISDIDFFNLDDQLLLESAVDYANAGFYDEALEILNRLNSTDGAPYAKNPMIGYWIGYLWQQVDPDMANFYFDAACKQSSDYCFPFRLESIKVLQAAMQINPQDANAMLYLGNLLYDAQPENAVAYWQKSANINADNWLTHRNLGYAYGRENKLDEAIAEYERAVALEKDARLLYELDVIYESANRSPADRLQFMQQREATVVQRDDALTRYCELLTINKKYDKAISYLDNNQFNKWEGGGSIHGVFVDAHVLRGLQSLQDKDYQLALADFEKALQYPRNLEVGRPIHDAASARAFYLAGVAAQKLKQNTVAESYFIKASQVPTGNSDFRYFQAMALQQLGKDADAKELLQRLLEAGAARLDQTNEVDFFAKFSGDDRQDIRQARAYYSIGLAQLGLGNKREAKDAFKQAQKFDPNNSWYDMSLYQ